MTRSTGTPILRALLDLRSLHWKITLLVSAACAAMALTVGVLVHGPTLRRSMHEGGVKAVEPFDLAQPDARRTGGPAPLADPAELQDALLRQVERHRQGTYYEDGPPAPVFWAAERKNGQLPAVRTGMTADLLTMQALDRHLWKCSPVTLAVVIPATALAMELPARRLRRVARTARRVTAGDLEARTGMSRRDGDEITEIAATADAMTASR
ncbi:hypothetical protein ROS62_23830 [Streptomyces sp. DSM 41972]|uniref:HAMP domain-containing protein n=1 Tax=Streptomyces althioticus subsp. attaecolombicae TaxID=3075534 RepID=A0ABU3I459_9ACTN|nr:hypothetical protein [Streptomyces sp. DSM 41972]SCD60689.1 HAMP domain-containing protein [Streptomyces sp. di50b]SCD60877.1 HAMP domain-containing protein [Streptomyces sp. di188]